MIQFARASFSIHSTETDPDRITEALGLQPTKVGRIGEGRGLGKPRSRHYWGVDGPRLGNTEEDQTGSAALAELVSIMRPAAGKVQNLPADCDAAIWWSADSDSTQGGFVLPAELLSALAELGVPLFGTIYVESDDEPDA